MLRKPIIFSGLFMLAAVAALPAQADELPLRKPGKWEMRTLSPPGMEDRVEYDCTDKAVDRIMMEVAIGVPYEIPCSKEIRKTATGYSFDFECKIPNRPSATAHTEFTGDFNSAFTMKTTSPGMQDDNIEAKWVGACDPHDIPGNIPTFQRMEKLKANSHP